MLETLSPQRITDPWKLAEMSFQDAAIHLTWEQQQCSNPKHDLMIQMAAAQSCNRDRAAIEKGDGVALLNTICRCFEHALSVPDWLSKEFIQRVDRITNMQAKDWSDSEVFGKPYSLGTKTTKKHKYRIQCVDAYLIIAKEISKTDDKTLGYKNGVDLACNELHAEDERTIKAMFERAMKDNNFNDPRTSPFGQGEELVTLFVKKELQGIRSFKFAGLDGCIIR